MRIQSTFISDESDKASLLICLDENSIIDGIMDEVKDILTTDNNPDGLFQNPITGKWITLVFGSMDERDVMNFQDAMMVVMLEFSQRGNMPKFVMVETNSSIELLPTFRQYLTGIFDDITDNLRASFYMTELRSLCTENFTSLSVEDQLLCGIEWKWRFTIEDDTNYDYLRDYRSVSPYGEIVHNWIYGQDYRQLDQLVITASLPDNRFDVIIRTPIDFWDDAIQASKRYGYAVHIIR